MLIGNRQLCTAPSKEYLSILIKWSINMSDIIVIHPFRGHGTWCDPEAPKRWAARSPQRRSQVTEGSRVLVGSKGLGRSDSGLLELVEVCGGVKPGLSS